MTLLEEEEMQKLLMMKKHGLLILPTNVLVNLATQQKRGPVSYTHLAKYFVNKPARSCVAVKTLPKNVLCEVEVIAAV